MDTKFSSSIHALILISASQTWKDILKSTGRGKGQTCFVNEGEEIQYDRFTVSDSGRRQNWEIQHSVTMDSMYSKLTTGAWQEINNKPW